MTEKAAVPRVRLGTSPRRRPWWRAAVAATAVVLLAAACSDDDDAAGGETSTTTSSSTSTSSSTTTTTQPPGTERAAIEPIIEDLLARLDEIHDEIIKDPSVVLDRDAPILAALAEVHAPGEAYSARLRGYRQNAETDRRVEALNGERVIRTTLVGRLTTVDRNTVEGWLCNVYNYRATSAEGGEIRDGLTHPGRVMAVRLDGTWMIQQIDVDDTQVCDPETVT